MEAIDAYLLCGTPRTGSTLLCGLLESTGVAGRPESYFRVPDEQSWAKRWRLRADYTYLDYVRAAIDEGTTPNGVFGGRVMWGTLDVMVDRLAALRPDLADDDLALLTEAFGRTRFVHVRRDDTVAQAVSWARAEQTRYWHAGDTATAEPRFDHAQIDELVRTIAEHDAAWERWFQAFGVTPHVVCYEALTRDMAGVVKGIAGFLGLELPPGHAIVPGHRRQADDINADWAARYRAAAG